MRGVVPGSWPRYRVALVSPLGFGDSERTERENSQSITISPPGFKILTGNVHVFRLRVTYIFFCINIIKPICTGTFFFAKNAFLQFFYMTETKSMNFIIKFHSMKRSKIVSENLVESIQLFKNTTGFR